MTNNIVIAGGGIGGLSAGLALALKNEKVVIFEKSDAKKEVGAGIQIGPNGNKVLSAIGLIEKVKTVAFEPYELSIYDGLSANELTSLPLSSFMMREYSAPYLTIARYDLHNILLKACKANKNITIKNGEEIEDYNYVKGRHSLNIKTIKNQIGSGESKKLNQYDAKMLIGADGVWSNIRSKHVGDGKAFFTGQIAWRKTIDIKDVSSDINTKNVCLWLGPKTHLVHYPIEAGTKLNIVAITEGNWQSKNWNEVGAFDELKSQFVDWEYIPNSLINLMDEPIKWALCGRIPSALASTGLVTLLGDAYHPMLPYLAQGAVMALEDAYILANQLAIHKDVATSIKNYERVRNERVMKVQNGAFQNATTYHYEGIRASVRNSIIALSKYSPSTFFGGFNWLYGYDVTQL